MAQSCLTLNDPKVCPWNSPGKNTGVGCHSLLQGIFPTQGSNPCHLYWQADSLPPSPQRSLFTHVLLIILLSHPNVHFQTIHVPTPISIHQFIHLLIHLFTLPLAVNPSISSSLSSASPSSYPASHPPVHPASQSAIYLLAHLPFLFLSHLSI